MNLNYVGSVAERFFQFRSRLQATEGVPEDLFNAISIYMPKSLALANLSEDSYDPSAVDAEHYAVIAVTVDNYARVLAEGSVLLSQWLPVFNDGTNFNVKLYVVVFDDTNFAPSLSAGAITWSPLTKAFNELYFISLFKVMFSEHYDGKKVVSDPVQPTDYDDSNYFDMALCLAYLCELEATLSWAMLFAKIDIFNGGTDENHIKVQSLSRGDETQHCTTLVGTTVEDRASYFWGYVNLIGASHTNLIAHNGHYLVPIILGRWFEARNSSGQFIGNKLAKIRLTGNKIKPTGNPSPLNSDVNLNPPTVVTDNLDAKNVGYLISIANDSDSDSELIRDRSVSNMPATAYAISKWIDYNSSQDMAKFATAIATLTKPVLANEDTYATLQSFLTKNIAVFTELGRLADIQIDFPPYSEAKKGNWFEGTAVWSARYVDDLEGVRVSGSISF
jgi:hypothetical protein